MSETPAETPAATIAALYRYPVKGLSPEPLTSAALVPGEMLAADRRYAVENGPSGFDPAAPAFFPKTYFLMLMRDERLAALETHYDDESHVLTVRREACEVARGDLSTAEGRQAIETYLAAYCAGDLRGPPRVLAAAGHNFSDFAPKVVSLINLGSLAAIAREVGQPVDPLRFRANVYLDGWPAWHELDLVGATLAIGEARLKVVKRIKRCAATNVDPVTAKRDLNIPQTLMRMLGHVDCGVYAEVVAGGTMRPGDRLTRLYSGMT
ncbi:MAG: MOSC domain-containing protein [Proteobacteria bacterium]|nr:MAG: MOSC domain-containing protein [Pseudomonadota bacterium]